MLCIARALSRGTFKLGTPCVRGGRGAGWQVLAQPPEGRTYMSAANCSEDKGGGGWPQHMPWPQHKSFLTGLPNPWLEGPAFLAQGVNINNLCPSFAGNNQPGLKSRSAVAQFPCP